MNTNNAPSIWLICSQKGGVGKSTIATNLAATASHNGLVVALLDTDTQSTSATWAADRSETTSPGLTCIQKLGNITATALELSETHDLVIIDSGGRDSDEMRTGMLAADLLIAPFKCSQADLDTVYHLNDVINQASERNPKLKAVALLSISPTHHANTEIAAAREYLSGHMTVLDSTVHDRKAYRDALSLGIGVTEHTDRKAKAEIMNLYGEVSNV